MLFSLSSESKRLRELQRTEESGACRLEMRAFVVLKDLEGDSFAAHFNTSASWGCASKRSETDARREVVSWFSEVFNAISHSKD